MNEKKTENKLSTRILGYGPAKGCFIFNRQLIVMEDTLNETKR